MQFFKLASLIASAALVAGNTITFKSLDDITREIVFTGNPGMPQIPTTIVPGGQSITVAFPVGWTGNYFSISEGATNTVGMLGEVAFDTWGGLNFFDVSAIVDPTDKNGVKKLFPTADPTNFSGCDLFPCDFAYYAADDVQTKASLLKDFTQTLGGFNSPQVREASSPVFTRDFVLGKW